MYYTKIIKLEARVHRSKCSSVCYKFDACEYQDHFEFDGIELFKYELMNAVMHIYDVENDYYEFHIYCRPDRKCEAALMLDELVKSRAAGYMNYLGILDELN